MGVEESFSQYAARARARRAIRWARALGCRYFSRGHRTRTAAKARWLQTPAASLRRQIQTGEGRGKNSQEAVSEASCTKEANDVVAERTWPPDVDGLSVSMSVSVGGGSSTVASGGFDDATDRGWESSPTPPLSAREN